MEKCAIERVRESVRIKFLLVFIISLIIINIVIRRRSRQHKNYEFKTFFKDTSQIDTNHRKSLNYKFKTSCTNPS